MELGKNGDVSYKQLMEAVGIDPKYKCRLSKAAEPCTSFKEEVRKQLRVLDEQNAINRYVWYNLPDGLTGQLLERILYYRAQGMFFWLDDEDDGLGTFYFLPYALDGNIDVYGRYETVTPLPFNGSGKSKKENAWIPGLTRKIDYEFPKEVTADTARETCVLLRDYTNQMGEENIPRQSLQEPLLDYMAEILPLSRTRLYTSTGVQGFRVQDKSELWAVDAANDAVKQSALDGKPWVGITRPTNFDSLNLNGSGNVDDYLLTLQTLDNYRLSLYGLKQGGIFDKSQYVNQMQAGIQQANVGLVYQDGLTNRQRFCDEVNKRFGPILLAKTGRYIWCDTSETVSSTDNNRDGYIADRQDQSGMVEGQQEVQTDANVQSV